MKTIILCCVVASLLCAAYAQGPAYPYSTALTFTASTSPTVTGYNMYRAPFTTVCGTYTKLNASPFTGTSYTDNNPPEGKYCYEATAVDPNGESGPSNVFSNVTIPPPPPTGLGATVAQGSYTSNVTLAWTQSTGPIVDQDAIWCSTSATTPLTKRWTSATPTGSHVISLAKGTHNCAVTAIWTGLESGFSDVLSVAVP